MKVGWNRRYILHSLLCRPWRRHSSQIAGLLILPALLLAFPEPSASVFPADKPAPLAPKAGSHVVLPVGLEIQSMDAFLKRHEVVPSNRSRLAESIVTTAKKYNLNPKLIASILIIESRGNPFAISGKDAVGLMQIHLPTWGLTADKEGINLLKIEDNIDFGARILKDYTRQFGLWEGVKRYNGFFADDPASEQSAQEYVAKVQKVFEFHPATSPQAEVVQ
jgi:soluble lytic murein transglycosylase-like protein